MSSASIPYQASFSAVSIWLTGVSFVLFQFFIQLSSGVVLDYIMREMQLTALVAGLLSSAFYYVYTTMQIPVGILFDRRSTRLLLGSTALICSFGCFLFAHSHNVLLFFIARLLIGAGASFAFVGLSHLLREHFPLNRFAFMFGLSETLGFMITVAGIIGLGAFISHLGWRSFVNGAGVAGIVISILCFCVIPANKKNTKPVSHSTLQQLKQIALSARLWANGLYVGLCFTIITVFGALWAIPFLQLKLNCSLKEASLVDAMLFCGAAISCPSYGYLTNHFRRRPLMVGSALSTAVLMLVALFATISSIQMMALILFAMGICCGAYMLTYTVANELSPPDAVSTCTGFTNTLAMLTAPLMQPLIGLLLDYLKEPGQGYSVYDYQWALTTVPAALVVASLLALALPEKKQE
ncbi:MFS transporter [Legionella dresdenensis]|uniref:Lysosomal dipeptide transporter MFSD1 n=1 Tax=Legionella dresdenensis TaxID=450200 RepID=A0ABV8CFJ3_9GAMM